MSRTGCLVNVSHNFESDGDYTTISYYFVVKSACTSPKA